MSTTVADRLIEKVRNMAVPKPVEPLPRPAEIITPNGTRYQFVIPAEGSEGLQAWESSDPVELCGKLFKSLQHANAYIQRQKRELKELRTLLARISAYVAVLSRLRGAEAEAELLELQRIVEQCQS